MSEIFERLPEEKQFLIIKTGLREFAHKSFSEAGTEKIVQAAGISKGSLFYYFGSKAGLYLYLLRSCMRTATEELEEREVTTGTVGEMMKNAFMQRLAFAQQNPILTRFIIRASKETAAPVRAQTRRIIDEYLITEEKRLRALIGRALDAAELRIDRKTSQMCLAAWWMYMSLYFVDSYTESVGRPNTTKEQTAEAAARFLDAFLYGILKQRPDSGV